MMKRIVLLSSVIISSLVLSACAMLQGGGQSGNQAAPSVMASMVQQRVEAKGPQMFCSQPTYQKCTGLEQAQCETEMQGFADRCFTVAQQQSGGAGVSSAAFTSSYVTCMTVNHALMHPEQAEQIKSCVADADFDYAAMLRSMLY